MSKYVYPKVPEYKPIMSNRQIWIKKLEELLEQTLNVTMANYDRLYMFRNEFDTWLKANNYDIVISSIIKHSSVDLIKADIENINMRLNERLSMYLKAIHPEMYKNAIQQAEQIEKDWTIK